MASSDDGQDERVDAPQESERFDPDRDGPELAYEHVHRYRLAAPLVAGLRVLDLACGSGYGSRLLATAGARVTALDLATSGLEGLEHAVCADATRLPFPDACFEAVVCFEAIEHVPAPAALVAEVRRVLGGPSLFLVSTPDRLIYSERAGHRNPHHVAELSREELEALLGRHFAHVALWGQSLWAGSWVAPLDLQTNVDPMRSREIGVERWQPPSTRIAGGGARWADPEGQELPVPVYLLAACTDSDETWNRVNRRWSRDSVLHDPAQWLLGQYERLLADETREDGALGSQLERARRDHDDLSRQLAAARSAIDDLEDQVRRSRAVVDRQRIELEAARAASDDQTRQLDLARAAQQDLGRQLDLARAAQQDLGRQLDLARAAQEDQSRQLQLARTAQEDLGGQIEAARAAALTQAREIEAARARILEQEADLLQSHRLRETLEQEIGRAREAIGGQRAELERAESGAKDLEEQIEAARAGQLDLLDQIDRARQRITAQAAEIADARAAAEAERRATREELAGARRATSALEAEIAEARRSATRLEHEIAAARENGARLEAGIEEARGQATRLEQERDALQATLTGRDEALAATLARAEQLTAELAAARTEIATAHARLATLERDRDRFWARVGHRLADWTDRSSGGRK